MSASISRRALLAMAGATAMGAATLGLSSCGKTQASSSNASTSENIVQSKYYEPSLIRVGYRGGVYEAPLFVALHQGFFAKYGVQVEMVPIEDSPSKLLSKSGDYLFVATPDYFAEVSEGLDLKFMSAVCNGCVQVVAAQDAEIWSVQDLPGKKVGKLSVTADAGQIAVNAALTKAGFDYNQVEWVVVGDVQDALSSLKSGKIQAFASLDPWCGLLASYCDLSVVYGNSSDPEATDSFCCLLAGNGSMCNNDELAGRVCKAVDEACNWLVENPTLLQKVVDSDGYLIGGQSIAPGLKWSEYDAKDGALISKLASTYSFGDSGSSAFDRSLRYCWNTLKMSGQLTTGRSIDDLCRSTGVYAL